MDEESYWDKDLRIQTTLDGTFNKVTKGGKSQGSSQPSKVGGKAISQPFKSGAHKSSGK